MAIRWSFAGGRVGFQKRRPRAGPNMIRQQTQLVDDGPRPPEPPYALQIAALRGIYPLAATLAAAGIPPLANRAHAALFLQCYAERICPVELAVIQQAFTHASGNHLRELIALDRSSSQVTELRELAGTSARVGRLQLEQLRPLRDQRLVQRYWEAVEGGTASGHHWVVYGLTLAIFSVPLRQGLLDFGRGTLIGLAAQSAKQLVLPEVELAALLAAAEERLPDVIEAVLSCGGWSGLGTKAG